MKRNSRRMLGVALVLALGLASACGGDDDDGAAASEPSSPPSIEAADETTVPAVTEPQTVSETNEPGDTSPASGEPSAELIAAAQAEGELVWYTSEQELVANNAAQVFEDKYGIDVTVFRASSGQLLQRFTAERDADSANIDFLDVAVPDFFVSDGEKYIEPLDVSLLPGEDVLDRRWIGEFGATVHIIPWAFAYNPDLVDAAELPTGWTDLVGPEWNGRIYLMDPRTVSASVQAFYLMLLEKFGPEFLEQLGANGVEYVADTVTGANQLVAGSRAGMLPNTWSTVGPLKDSGAPIDQVLFDDTTGAEQTAGVVIGSEHPNAAKLMLNFLFSEEGQTALVGFGGGVTPLSVPIDGAIPTPSGYVSSDTSAAPLRVDEIAGLLGL